MRSDTDFFYKIADILLMPSRYEGLGISGIEAQSSGMTCIMSDKIPQECLICKNIYSLKLKRKLWIKKIEEVIALKNYGFIENNYESVNSSGFSLASLRSSILDIYLNN